MQDRIKELEQEIKELKAKQDVAQSWKTKVRNLDSFTVDEKIGIFDELYKRAYDYLEEWAKRGYGPKDGNHYIYEAAMSGMLGERVWEIIRSLS